MIATHTDDCVHLPYYDGDEPCECNWGVWMQPQGSYFDDAKGEAIDDRTPYCRLHERAWELQLADE